MEAEERPSKKLKASHISLSGDTVPQYLEIDSSHESGDSPPKNSTSRMPFVDGSRSTDEATDTAITAFEGVDTSQTSESKEEQRLHHDDMNRDSTSTAQPVISKNQLKKQKRQEQWELKSDDRKAKRKQKTAERKERQRAAKAEASVATTPSTEAHKSKSIRPIQTPITIIIDCQFDEYMLEQERKSLGTQLTRCYSDNRKAPFKAHMIVSSFHGPLRERFETVLSNTHRSWKGVQFDEDDCASAANAAQIAMKEDGAGSIAGALRLNDSQAPKSDQQLRDEGEIIYLSSDSPNTLTELKPYSTYIIGGIVDRNRAKGLCYQKAMEIGISTAKLPIGEYIQMASRSVLTTDHVFKIMLQWLELGDWAEAFLRVLPKRKGGVLRHRGDGNLDEVAVASDYRGAFRSESIHSAGDSAGDEQVSTNCHEIEVDSDNVSSDSIIEGHPADPIHSEGRDTKEVNM